MPRYYVKNRRPSCQFLSTRRERREFGLGRGSRPWLPVVFIAVISVPGRYHQRYHYYRACTLSVSFTVARLWKLMINFPTLSRSARVWCRSALSLRTPRHALVFPRRPTDDGLFLARWRRDLDQFNLSSPLSSVPQTSIDRVNLVQRYWTWTLDVFSSFQRWNKLLSTGWW